MLCRSGILSGLLDRSFQWVVHLLRRSNGVEDPVLGDCCLRVHLAGETRSSCWSPTIISVATPAEELREPVLAVVN